MKRLVLLTITIALTLGIILCFTAVSVKAETPDISSVVSTYDSIKVAQGETLADIASKYNTCGVCTNAEYIEEIKRINKIYTDTIHAGCYLTVISYSE